MTESIAEPKTVALYKVVFIEQIDPPTGVLGDWYRYVIQRGESKIEGQHAGGLNDVTEHAETFAESLNERLSKKYPAYGSQGKK